MTYGDLIDDIQREFPAFKLCAKADSGFMSLVSVLLRILTFGQSRSFMDDYTTTIGNTVYTPSKWSMMSEHARMTVLRHERVHLRQALIYGRLTFSLLYLFFPLPLGLAYYRAKFEMEAYEETLRAELEYYGVSALYSPINRENIVGQFTGPAYGWMWPFRSTIEAWHDRYVRFLTDTPNTMH